MRNRVLLLLLLLLSFTAHVQQPDKLTIEKIMRDPKWIGTSPSNLQWSADSKKLYFYWNPEQAPADSLYYITMTDKTPVKASVAEKRERVTDRMITFNKARTAYVYSRDGDIFYTDVKTGATKRITRTIELEINPSFSFTETKVVYIRNLNLYAWSITTGETQQLTNIRGNAGTSPGRGGRENTSTTEEEWLKNEQLRYLDVLRSRKAKRDAADQYIQHSRMKELRSISIEDKNLQEVSISPDGRFISYRLFKPAANSKNTIVPDYVTESGYTTDIPGRAKVGSPQGQYESFLYDRSKDTVVRINTDSLPGIKDIPLYLKDYPGEWQEQTRKNANRDVVIAAPVWSPNGLHAIYEIESRDNKDRWLALLDTADYQLTLLDRQHDEAWIGGPGINSDNIGWIDENTCWFQREDSFSHVYLDHIQTGDIRPLTAGHYEVQQAALSTDKKYFYISTNEIHPGEQQFYRLSVATRKQERITTMTGANNVLVSPDEKYIAILYSYSNRPWELYVQENKPGGKLQQVTDKAQSEEFKSYHWLDPELITFPARDGAHIYARLYKPAMPDPAKPAVLFVHGAGYLQNAHKWWSSYFREYMFNNLLAENGYYVMDIDYRGSAGYGRDWRTAIYRHMGGKDLSDQADGVQYLVENFGVNPAHVGIYGGSYGGFITLMALFTQPDVFAAGGAIRSVTDWANYNHGYTSNILNEPFTDSIAYRRSSPIYFAEGLKGHLLMCHGMVDVNVHFQDIVKLTQRLIELGKDNWELAVYPVEDHGFVEPSSWTDEYKRIFRLFENTLKHD